MGIRMHRRAGLDCLPLCLFLRLLRTDSGLDELVWKRDARAQSISLTQVNCSMNGVGTDNNSGA